VVSIDLPALNQRSSDIPLLLAHFCQAASVRYRRERRLDGGPDAAVAAA
jgi:two-component system C4-dicarboxylate transport response regulator DctD